MKQVSLFFWIILFSCIAVSCKGVFDSGSSDGYYVKYEAEALEGTDTTVFHTVTLYLPQESQPSRFMCKSKFNETYGPYNSGENLRFVVDIDKNDSYLVKIYVKKNKSGIFQLVKEDRDYTSYTTTDALIF